MGPMPFGRESPYSEDFLPGAPGLGIGDFVIEPSAAPQMVTGVIRLYFDVYTDDTFNELLPQVVLTNEDQVNIEPEVVSSVPEPGALGLILFGLGAVGLSKIRKRLASALGVLVHHP